ncbi:MAG: K+-sensing histidine kinase KdpD, partial [Rhodothermales bacterium]
VLHVSNDIPSELPQMAANEQQLQRFLALYLEGALAELPSGSKLVWTAEEQHSRCHGDSILLEIVDDGNGLSDRHLGLPFRAFDSEDAAPHLALNQLICYMIAYYHDAKIAISENSEGGVTIGIRLPLKPQPRETGGDAFFDLFVPES